ncbi:MAG: SLC13 family permease [Deltaproteobacteria bacterium]
MRSGVATSATLATLPEAPFASTPATADVSAGLIAFAIVGAAMLLSEWLLPASLPAPARRCLGVFVATAAFWAWGRPAPAVTALLALVLLPATGALPSARVFSAFGSETVFFALGALLLAAALQATGLSGRVALWALHAAKGSPARARLALYLLAGGLSLVMSEHAVAALTLPLAFDLAERTPASVKVRGYETSLCLAVAWGTTAGGVGTMLGGSRAPLALGLLEAAHLPRFGFLGYAAAALPISLPLLVVGALLLHLLYPLPKERSLELAKRVCAERQELPPFSRREGLAAAIFGAAVLAWALLGDRLGLASIGLAAGVALVATGAVTWKDLEHRVHWGAVVLIGGAVALGGALTESGASVVLAKTLFAPLPPALLPGVLLAVTVLLTSVMSHAATVATVLPLALSLVAPGQAREVTLLVAVASGLGFALPASGTATALAIGAGKLAPRDLLLGGTVLTATAALLVFTASHLLWPILAH